MVQSWERRRQGRRIVARYVPHSIVVTWHGDLPSVLTTLQGSCLHAVRALEAPRWEDFKYEFLDGVKNRFHWLGDGSTYNEKHMVGDREYTVAFTGIYD